MDIRKVLLSRYSCLVCTIPKHIIYWFVANEAVVAPISQLFKFTNKKTSLSFIKVFSLFKIAIMMFRNSVCYGSISQSKVNLYNQRIQYKLNQQVCQEMSSVCTSSLYAHFSLAVRRTLKGKKPHAQSRSQTKSSRPVDL